MTGLYRDFQSPAELDAAYMVPLAIPNYAEYAARFRQASEAPLADASAVLGERYGLTTDEYVDVFPAPGRGPAPVLIFIHGGYWRAFSARDFAFACLGPRARGMLTLVPNYSLAPYAPIGEIVRQMRAAVVWALRNAERFGGDPRRIVCSGHSAGGHLSAMAALTDWSRYELDRNPVASVHAISGLFDLRPLPYTSHAPALQLGPHDIVQLSPMLHDLPPALPPFVLSYGGAETAEFRRQSEDFATRLRRRGHRAETLPLAGENHLDAVFGLTDPDSVLMRRIAISAEAVAAGTDAVN